MLRNTVKIILILCLAAASGCRRQESSDVPSVAVTNTYLECAVKDLLGADIPVMRLAGPGMCPGHFDIRPSQLTRLRSCRLLFRFDFQKSLETKISNTCDKGLKISAVKIPGGLCRPESYLTACMQASEVFVNAGMLERQQAELRIKEIQTRISEKENFCRKQFAHLKGFAVIASSHQKDFCEWLGLNVVDTFRGSDVESISQVNQAIRNGQAAEIKLVIANLPEGTRVAEALAMRLGAKVVVFENFPALDSKHTCFDDLLEQNVEALLKAGVN